MVLDLPLCRLRQIVAAIRLRQFERLREERFRVSWQTRQLAIYIAAGYMTDGKSENVMLERARTLAIDPYETELLEYLDKSPANQPAAKENAVGSYERLLGAFSQTKG